jgi:hypothetical protein
MPYNLFDWVNPAPTAAQPAAPSPQQAPPPLQGAQPAPVPGGIPQVLEMMQTLYNAPPPPAPLAPAGPQLTPLPSDPLQAPPPQGGPTPLPSAPVGRPMPGGGMQPISRPQPSPATPPLGGITDSLRGFGAPGADPISLLQALFGGAQGGGLRKVY